MGQADSWDGKNLQIEWIQSDLAKSAFLNHVLFQQGDGHASKWTRWQIRIHKACLTLFPWKSSRWSRDHQVIPCEARWRDKFYLKGLSEKPMARKKSLVDSDSLLEEMKASTNCWACAAGFTLHLPGRVVGGHRNESKGSVFPATCPALKDFKASKAGEILGLLRGEWRGKLRSRTIATILFCNSQQVQPPRDGLRYGSVHGSFTSKIYSNARKNKKCLCRSE